MRYFLKKTIFVAIILLILGVAIFIYNYTANNFKTFIVKTLENNLKSRISIGRIQLGFPLHVELRDVKINSSIDIKNVDIYPNTASLLSKNKFIVEYIKIVEPVIRIKNKEEAILKLSDIFKTEDKTTSGQDAGPVFSFSKISFEKGALIYAFGNDAAIECCRIKGVLEGPGPYFSNSRKFTFKVIGFFKNQYSDFLSPFEILGWTDKDGMVKIKLKADKVDCESLGPIYAKYLKNNIERAKFGLLSNISILNDKLDAECYLKGEDIVFKKSQINNKKEPLIMSFILGVNFKERSIKINNLESNFLSVLFDIS